jgi:tRNA pseudouridine13 synthase
MRAGNRFDIVLRNLGLLGVDDASSEDVITVVDACCSALKQNGFINYFGMQRFGKYYDNTEAGVLLMKNNFAGAIDVLMRVKTGDDKMASAVRALWDNRDTTDDATVGAAAASCLKRLEGMRGMLSECNLMRHLSKNPSDFKGAFFKIPKNMSLMFLHAVQSAVFNKVASLRIGAHGSTVVEGDLVEINATTRKERVEGEKMKTQMEGKDVVVVTKEDVENNTYGIDDVVLPLPGSKVLIPPSCAQFYVDVLKEMFDEADESKVGMKDLFTNATTKEFSLGGDYRKLVCKVDDLTWKVVSYDTPTAPLFETDLMTLRGEKLSVDEGGAQQSKDLEGREAEGKEEEGKKEVVVEEEGKTKKENSMLGLVVGFTLQSSSYATVAMRELQRAPQLTEFLKTRPLTKAVAR